MLRLDYFPEDYTYGIRDTYYTNNRPYYWLNQGFVDIPKLPVGSITSVVTIDSANASTTYASSNYTLDAAGARLLLNEGAQFPLDLREKAAVEITFVSGYGATAADVPSDIKTALLSNIAEMYECRRICSLSTDGLQALSAYKVYDNLGLYYG